MQNYFSSVLGLTASLIVSLVIIYPHPTFALPPLSDGNIKTTFEEGVNKSYLLYAPTGEITASQYGESGNPEKKLFTTKTIDTFKILGKIGLIQIKPFLKQFDIMQYYNVSLTDKGKKVNVGTNEVGFYLFKIAEAKVSKIIKNTEYKNSNNPSEEFRLVLGIYDFFPTELGKEWYAAQGKQLQKKYKFKALFKYDPFQEKYTLASMDWGYLDKDKYETNNIK